MSSITIRSYQPEDAPVLTRLFYDAVHHISSEYYTKKQLDAWAPKRHLEPEGWMKKWEKYLPLVAIKDSLIVGFAEFEPSGHIDCFYVHHLFQGVGVGSALLNAIEEQARKNNCKRIWAQVGLNAQPFFSNKGFTIIKKQVVERRGQKLENYVMEKYLNRT